MKKMKYFKKNPHWNTGKKLPPWTDESKKKLSKSRLGVRKKGICVIDKETQIIYDSILKACDEVGIKYTSTVWKKIKNNKELRLQIL